MSHNYYFIKETSEEVIIGVIDNGLSKNYSNIITNTDKYKSEETHGDFILDFTNQYCPNAKVYFFDASDENGKVSTKSIQEGLVWMKNQGVEYANISLSSAKY